METDLTAHKTLEPKASHHIARNQAVTKKLVQPGRTQEPVWIAAHSTEHSRDEVSLMLLCIQEIKV